MELECPNATLHVRYRSLRLQPDSSVWTFELEKVHEYWFRNIFVHLYYRALFFVHQMVPGERRRL